jgi:hypothetical protein
MSDRISTARELMVLHPGITVVRDRIGLIDAASEPPSPFGDMMVHFSPHEVEEDVVDGLTLTASHTSGQIDSSLRVPLEGGLDALEVVRPGEILPERTVSVARAAIELFAAYQDLPPEEKRELTILPYGNAKVYDWERPAIDTREAVDQAGASEQIADWGESYLNTTDVARRIFLDPDK